MGEQPRLSHIDERGQARMVDVSEKPPTVREATARGWVEMETSTLQAALSGVGAKGDALAVARIAGILAAKRTSELIPLCHPLPLTGIQVDLRPNSAAGRVEIEATVRTTAPTGVEMEALTAASVAALTLYDMLKAVDKGMVIGGIRLVRKSGGKGGEYRRPGEAGPELAPGP